MKLPEEVREDLRGRFGEVTSATALGGGCISSASRIAIGRESFFLKYEWQPPDGFFGAEAAGLEQLGAVPSGLHLPELRGYRDNPASWGWIALEWLAPGTAKPGFWERLGSGLATLHRARGKTATWGWERHGFIGRLPQSNAYADTWAEFWHRERLLPQLNRAERTRGIGSTAEWARLAALLPQLLAVAESEGASLLHGDLWHGNVVASPSGPALIDPSCYRGHREVDLAMAELFGGFDQSFFDAYAATWPLAPGYEVRRAAYQLYYLLVHVNLFGAAYAPRTELTLRRILKSTQSYR